MQGLEEDEWANRLRPHPDVLVTYTTLNSNKLTVCINLNRVLIWLWLSSKQGSEQAFPVSLHKA